MQPSDDEIRVLAPTGVTGSGFRCSGASAFPTTAIKRDLRLMMIGAHKIKAPRYTVKLEGAEKVGYMRSSLAQCAIHSSFVKSTTALHATAMVTAVSSMHR